MDKRIYSKEAEIKAIIELADMGGYFADTFGNEIEQIIGNIKNDFPFEFGTKITNELSDEKEAHKRDVTNLCDTMLRVYDTIKDDRMYTAVCEKLGKGQTIIRKHELGLNLSKDEIGYLIETLKNK